MDFVICFAAVHHIVCLAALGNIQLVLDCYVALVGGFFFIRCIPDSDRIPIVTIGNTVVRCCLPVTDCHSLRIACDGECAVMVVGDRGVVALVPLRYRDIDIFNIRPADSRFRIIAIHLLQQVCDRIIRHVNMRIRIIDRELPVDVALASFKSDRAGFEGTELVIVKLDIEVIQNITFAVLDVKYLVAGCRIAPGNVAVELYASDTAVFLLSQILDILICQADDQQAVRGNGEITGQGSLGTIGHVVCCFIFHTACGRTAEDIVVRTDGDGIKLIIQIWHSGQKLCAFKLTVGQSEIQLQLKPDARVAACIIALPIIIEIN